jgi:septum formation protein
MRLILASASPRRAQLLREMRLRFHVAPTAVDEWHDETANPERLVRHNCRLKAIEGARRHPDEPVLAADSTVSIDGCNLDKPSDLAVARGMLRRLAGRTHAVYTGVSVIFRPEKIEETICVCSEVTFKSLEEGDIEGYLATVNPLDKAGAYGIQAGRELIIDDVSGSVTNVMGLPVTETENLLRRHSLFDRLMARDDAMAVD